MDFLKELISLISPNKLKKINLIHDLDDEAKLKQLYMGKHHNRWADDAEAINELYGSKDGAAKFSKLKHDLTQRLLQLFPLINITKFDEWEYRKAFWECVSIHNTAKLIINLTNNPLLGTHLLEKYFDRFMHYEFTDLIVSSAEYLNTLSRIRTNNIQKAEYYTKIALEYSIIQMLEIQGNIYLTEIYGYHARDKSVKKFLPEKILQYIDNLNKIYVEKPTQKLLYYKQMLHVCYHMVQFKYIPTLAACEEAIAFFKQKPYLSRLLFKSFYLQAIVCHTYLRDFEGGYKKVQEAIPFFDEGTLGWFKMRGTAFQLCIHSKEYQKAYEIMHDTMQSKNYDLMPPNIKQWWMLQDGYLFILSKFGKLALNPDDKQEFRFFSFVNNIPIWSGDKKGLNFSIHVLYLTHLMLQNNEKSFQTYIDRLEPMQTYARRYTGDDEMHRSRLMVRIFDRIAANNFNKRKYRKDKSLQSALYHLINEPYDLTDSNLDVEPVPFQDICEYLFDHKLLDSRVVAAQ